MVILGGGALLLDRKRENSRESNALSAFLDFIWHGAHNGGIGKDRDMYIQMPIAEDVIGGQFELYLCSTRCLRAFLNALVDEFEGRIKRTKDQARRDKDDPRRSGLPRSVSRLLDRMKRQGIIEDRSRLRGSK